MAYHSFEDLDVWKRGCQLAVFVHEQLHGVRNYGLKDQMERASVSIPSNISEGSERTPKDFARMLRIASGSAAELRTQTYIAFKLSLLDEEAEQFIVDETRQLGRMLFALRQSLESNDSSP